MCSITGGGERLHNVLYRLDQNSGVHGKESPYSLIIRKMVLRPFLGQDQDQDSLLVKRRNDNHSPGPVIRELVPSSHQRSELSNTIFSR